jgi:hypothetical protein
VLAPALDVCVLLSLLCLAQQQIAPSAARDATVYRLPADRDTALVPFRCVANQIRVDAMVNDRGPFRLILDTGMPTPGIVLFQSDRLAPLQLVDSGARVALGGAGGSGRSHTAMVANDLSVTLGELQMSGVSAMVLTDRAGLPPGVDGIIGGALFFRFVVRLDMDRSRLELTEPSRWSPPEGACIVPFDRVRGAAFVTVRVAVGDGAPIAASVVVDLGARHAISLNTRADGSLAPPARTLETSLGRGLSGVVRGKRGRIRRLELGSFAFENVIASFPIAEHRNPGGADFRDGNLGTEILTRFNITFDYGAARLVLEKSQRFDEPFEQDMSGLTFDWRPDGALVVRSVLPGSPAEEAGIEPDDRLLRIDGRTLADVGEDGIRAALTADGAEVELTFQRGFEAVRKRLRLRRML